MWKMKDFENMFMNFTESDSPTLNYCINHMDVHGDAN